MTQLYAYFSRPNDDVETQPAIDPVRFGPYEEFVQLTYQELRSGPDGDAVAWISPAGEWRVWGDRSEHDSGYWYSDVVITDRADG